MIADFFDKINRRLLLGQAVVHPHKCELKKLPLHPIHRELPDKRPLLTKGFWVNHILEPIGAHLKQGKLPLPTVVVLKYYESPRLVDPLS